MTKNDYQTIVNEIREVCKRHHVVLIGDCFSEGIYGEISILMVKDLSENDKKQISNVVDEHECSLGNLHPLIYVNGIGETE